MKTLIETNPYLKDPQTRTELIARSTATSCGVEGIKVTLENKLTITIPRRPKKIYQKFNK
jgi:hypothetical protein